MGNESEKKNITNESEVKITPTARDAFADALHILRLAKVPYLVGAAFARQIYTGIWRETKDMDIFVRSKDLKAALDVLARNGYRTEISEPTWLAKAFRNEQMIDLIFASNNGQLVVDDSWFAHPFLAEVLGEPVYLVPIEEMIAMASFVATRNRFDASEIVHLIHGVEGQLNWERVLSLLGEHRELLLWYLILFDYVYPGHSEYLPKELMIQLFAEASSRWQQPSESTNVFRGTLMDPFTFNVDISDWGYEDARQLPQRVDAEGNDLGERGGEAG